MALYVSPVAGVSVIVGSVFIDVDHYLWYGLRFKDWSFRRPQNLYKAKEADKYYCLCVFHTIESIALYIACLLLSGPIFWISIGCLLHIFFDVMQSICDKGLFRRKWSLIHALYYWTN